MYWATHAKGFLVNCSDYKNDAVCFNQKTQEKIYDKLHFTCLSASSLLAFQTLITCKTVAWCSASCIDYYFSLFFSSRFIRSLKADNTLNKWNLLFMEAIYLQNPPLSLWYSGKKCSIPLLKVTHMSHCYCCCRPDGLMSVRSLIH